ncbi:MAG: hypothetical protein ACP5IZ_11030 [Thermoprotei archaeon]
MSSCTNYATKHKQAKYFILLSGITSGIIVVMLLFVGYLINIVPFVVFIILGLLSGFLLAPLFYSKLETA